MSAGGPTRGFVSRCCVRASWCGAVGSPVAGHQACAAWNSDATTGVVSPRGRGVVRDACGRVSRSRQRFPTRLREPRRSRTPMRWRKQPCGAKRPCGVKEPAVPNTRVRPQSTCRDRRPRGMPRARWLRRGISPPRPECESARSSRGLGGFLGGVCQTSECLEGTEGRLGLWPINSPYRCVRHLRHRG
jgi:hypothetical protein